MAQQDLASLLAREQQSVNRVRCGPCKIIAELSPEDAAVLRQALDDPAISAAMVTRALQGLGYRLSSSALNRHLRECG